MFSAGVAQLAPVAYQFQGYKFNRAIMLPTVSRVTQAIVGEMSTDEAVSKITSDMQDAINEQAVPTKPVLLASVAFASLPPADNWRGGMIHVTRYDTRGPNEQEVRLIGQRRVRFVTDQYEAILAKDGFTIITEPMEDVIGEDGRPIFLLNEDAPPPRLEAGAAR